MRRPVPSQGLSTSSSTRSSIPTVPCAPRRAPATRSTSIPAPPPSGLSPTCVVATCVRSTPPTGSSAGRLPTCGETTAASPSRSGAFSVRRCPTRAGATGTCFSPSPNTSLRRRMAETPLQRALREERAFHDERYNSTKRLRPDTRGTFRDSITPPFLPHGSPRGLSQLRAYELLLREGVEGKRVLDYACGLGKWSVHLAQLSARVSGFDLSGVAIEHAQERA